MNGELPKIGAPELLVLKVLWAATGPVEARDVHVLLGRRHSVSAARGTLERLRRKGFVTRVMLGDAHGYTPALTREQLIGHLIRDLAARVAEGELEPVMAGFVQLVAEADPDLLRRLRDLSA